MTQHARCTEQADHPIRGRYAPEFAALAQQFALHFAESQEIGASLAVYQRGECVVDLWGGYADVTQQIRWQNDTRAVLYSCTKGLAAMALNMAADRGHFDWDQPVASVWPAFAQAGKAEITARTLFNHRAGLAALDQPLTLTECVDPSPAARARVRDALASQAPAWTPGRDQGYHAVTFGMYAQAFFEQCVGESMGTFLRRELFDPLGSDARLGSESALDAKTAVVYPPGNLARARNMIVAAVTRPSSNEARVLRASLAPVSIGRRAFLNPSPGPRGMLAYDEIAVRRGEFASANATASAQGLARAYLPFASGGLHQGRAFLQEKSISPVYARQGWSARDRVLRKPIGWSQGFLKEERGVFSPTRASFGHAGMGGALGWCDPVHELTFGYVLNGLDWRVRSPRAVALCNALYRCKL
ncbi:MAG: serine hydrolase domain-containing protein [Deltaproteobacteria bacterium]|nr:serine hydrolase domain-containing protein [Deltaproteobacteria bacterium]